MPAREPAYASVGAALRHAQALGLERLDAQLLLAALLDKPRSWLLIHEDHVLTAEQAQRYADWLSQRLADVPVAYLLGVQEFHGLTLHVNAHTLVPRADTETLVDWALEALAQAGDAPAVVDLGTGSGAIALAIKHRHPAARVEAVDFSADALAMAQANAVRLGLAVRFYQSDWWQGVPERKFDLIVSNPPYIAADDPHLPALRHEPRQALTPGGDGLAALSAIAAGAPHHLRPGGLLLLEHGYDQEAPVAALLKATGLEYLGCRRDLGGQPRVSAARRAR